MNSIGGYFELELRKGKEYHSNAIALNTGRNALELILKVKKYKKVFIPFYTCDVILEPLKKTKTQYEFYSIDKNVEPIFDYSTIKTDDGFLYTNYFGLKDSFVNKLAIICKNLIIDNSQAFFAKPNKNVPTFYSCRKFFGVPDGAYLYMEGISEIDLPYDNSVTSFTHLLKRIEYGAEAGYQDFKNNDNYLIGQPIKQMSKLTKALLCNIDYEFVKKIRKENFLFLHKELSEKNELAIDINKEFVPMIYPFLLKNKELKRTLIKNKIFVPTFWQNVLKWVKNNSIEFNFTTLLINIPIDQRVSESDLNTIIKIIKSNGK